MVLLGEAAMVAYSKFIVWLSVRNIDTDPLMPDNGRPNGSGPVLRIFGEIGAWFLLIVAGMAVIYIFVTLFNVLRGRAQMKDVGTPLMVFLVCVGFVYILNILTGAFMGVIR